MKSNVRSGGSPPRAFLLLVLVIVCFISVISYAVASAHGWGGGDSAWSTAQQDCRSQTAGNQSCVPFTNGWWTCSGTPDQSQHTGTPTNSLPSEQGQNSGTPTNGWQGQNGGTPTNGWPGWQNCAGTPGQNNGTPVSSPPACNNTTNQITGTQTPVATGAPLTQTPVVPVTPCPSPTSVLPPSSTPTVVPTSIPQTPIPSVVSSPVSTPVSGNDPQSQAAQAVFAQINQERASAGLPAFQWSTQLVQSAHNHNLAMQQTNQFSHQVTGEAPIGDRVTAVGITWSQAAENIAESSGNTTDSPAVISTNLNQGMFNEQPPDDGHRLNILSTNTLIGVDVLVDTQSNTLWLTEDFAKPA